jgi:hypothetical protein
MKRAKIILTALILFGIVGGVLAFKVKKFTLNPVYVSTDSISITISGNCYVATTDPFIAPFCKTVPIIYFTTNPGGAITVEAYKTTAFPLRTVIFIKCDNITITITRIVPFCIPTTTFAITAI